MAASRSSAPQFGDGRGKFPDRLTASVPVDMHGKIRAAAAAAGTSQAAFIRDAIDERLRGSTQKEAAHG